jgi:hypothetical protein
MDCKKIQGWKIKTDSMPGIYRVSPEAKRFAKPA